MKLLKDLDFQIIIPEKRINYITPKMIAGNKVGGSSFHSIWLTYGLNLPKQINYKSQNRAQDFATSKNYDAIDIYMAVNQCDFKTACKELSSL